MVFNDFSSDEEGSLSITADKRSHPDSQAGSAGQARRPQRRPQLWKRKPVKKEEEEGEERGAEVGLEGDGEESRDNDYEDEDFGKCLCTVTCTAHHNKYTRWFDNHYCTLYICPVQTLAVAGTFCHEIFNTQLGSVVHII